VGISYRVEYAARRFLEQRERARLLAALNAPKDADLPLGFLRMARTISAHRPKIQRLLDIGAHVGRFTHAATQIWPISEVVAVEPNSEVFEQLRAAIPRHAVIVSDAIDDSPRVADFFVHPDSTMNSLVSVDETSFQEQFGYYSPTAIRSRPVQVRTLDSLTAELGIGLERDLLLKIDTQGNELAILQSGHRILEQCSVCVVEYMFWSGYKKAHELDELIGFMKKEGFHLAGVLGAEFRPDGRASFADILFLAPQVGEQ
jgi:FkbM family methyltransferase